MKNNKNKKEEQKIVFSVTGTLSQPRDAIKTFIEESGAVFSDGVTAATKYLIIGDKPGKSKIEKAEKLNTEIIDEKKLIKIVNSMTKKLKKSNNKDSDIGRD